MATMMRDLRSQMYWYYKKRNNNNNNKNNNNNNNNNNNDGYESPYFEKYDISGDSYSLAWRYLGVYLDDDGYTRKVLWAAYYDPNYNGHQIGEYQYYDWEYSKWDNSTCTSGSPCRRMDCHSSNSYTWKLVGLYSESLEFDNDTFFEQLFKHQGFCLWGGDNSNYQFMQTMRGDLESYGTCTYVKSGIYIGPKPVEGGDLELAVYKDSYCTKEKSSSSSSSYSLVDKYATSSSGKTWSNAFQKWNSLMQAYKTCQPCRAYSRTANWQSDRQRRLVEYDDGMGEEETNGFNCYDDAGYRNCNQCYKFDTHSDMAEVDLSSYTLKSISKQGTLISFTVDGVTYGGNQQSDSYYSYNNASVAASSLVAVAAVVVLGAFFVSYRRKHRVIVTTEGNLPLDHPVLQA